MSATSSDIGQESKHKLAVLISYNGMNASFEYNPDHLAERTRVQALDHYDIRGPARHEVFLFAPDNQTEINDAATMGSQVTPDSQLYLHRRAQSGGGAGS
jgi:hypothetical protein